MGVKQFSMKRFLDRLSSSKGGNNMSSVTIEALRELSKSKIGKGEMINRAANVIASGGGGIGGVSGGSMMGGGGGGDDGKWRRRWIVIRHEGYLTKFTIICTNVQSQEYT